MRNPFASLFGSKPPSTPADELKPPASEQPAAEASASGEQSKPTPQPTPRNPADHLIPWRFQPGKSGNPGGRPKGRSITAELQELSDQLDETGDSVKRRIAKRLLLLAEEDLRAAKLVLERLDGKVPATSAVKAKEQTIADLVPELETAAESYVPEERPQEKPDAPSRSGSH